MKLEVQSTKTKEAIKKKYKRKEKKEEKKGKEKRKREIPQLFSGAFFIMFLISF
jgi:hypothetical protein